MDQEIFAKYLEELRGHLFGELLTEEILRSYRSSHRKSRYVSQMILKDKETFYRHRKPEYDLETINNKVLSALFHQEAPEPKATLHRPS